MKKGHRARMAWRMGQRKPADLLIMARIPDKGIASLISSFPVITGCTSGESRDPHVTLFGPFRMEGDIRYLPDIIEQMLSGVTHFSCLREKLIRLKGVRGGAIALRLDPEESLRAFYRSLVRALNSRLWWITWIDRSPGQRLFHITLRFNIPFREVHRVWERVTSLPESPRYVRPSGKEPGFSLRTYLPTCDAPLDLFRIALMRRGFLWKEYDLPRKVWLSRDEALNSGEWVKTREEYRRCEGLELRMPGDRKGGSPFVIGDLHLGHRNIIDYCRRPFSSSQEMDRVLIRNWNCTVRQGDGVYYLGDLRHGLHAPPASYYLDRLSGRISLICGNHDEGLTGGVRNLRISHQEIPFFLIHDPEEAPAGERGWVLHAHHHNNNIARYPFINTETRTINVSAELVNYAPVSLDEICGFITQAEEGEHLATLRQARERYPD